MVQGQVHTYARRLNFFGIRGSAKQTFTDLIETQRCLLNHFKQLVAESVQKVRVTRCVIEHHTAHIVAPVVPGNRLSCRDPQRLLRRGQTVRHHSDHKPVCDQVVAGLLPAPGGGARGEAGRNIVPGAGLGHHDDLVYARRIAEALIQA